MATTMNNNIIMGPGSPVSPSSIFAINKFQGEDISDLATKFPTIHKAPAVEPTAEAPKTEEPKQHHGIPFHESSSCYRRFKATSADVDAILRTVLPLNPSMAEHLYKATMDDVLVHMLGLQQAESDLFVGYMRGRRVVVARMSSDEFGLFCADEAQSQEFLVVLRSMDVRVQDV